MVLYDRLYDYTRAWHPCQFFKSFKNHTRLSLIHSNGPSVTQIRPWLVWLYVWFTLMANRISCVFCVQALASILNNQSSTFRVFSVFESNFNQNILISWILNSQLIWICKNLWADCHLNKLSKQYDRIIIALKNL